MVEEGRLHDGRACLRTEVTWVDRFGNLQLAATVADARVAGMPSTGCVELAARVESGRHDPDGLPRSLVPDGMQLRCVDAFGQLEQGEFGLLVDANGHLAVVAGEASAAHWLNVVGRGVAGPGLVRAPAERFGAAGRALGTIRRSERRAGGVPTCPPPPRRIPEATVLRLPIYQRILAELVRGGSRTVSSEQLAELARVNAAKVRKDLSLLGSFGTRGSGYDPEFLIAQIDRALGVDENWSVAMVGIGNLGRALTNSAGFASRGCQVTSLFDVDPAVVGEEIRGMRVRHMDELATLRAGEAPTSGSSRRRAGRPRGWPTCWCGPA